MDVEKAGLTHKSGKIECTNEQTTVPHIYCIGDVVHGKPELTPVAVQAGRLLVKRLFAGSTKQMDYTDIATAIFTPLEYGTVGLSEADAIASLGRERVKVYHTDQVPLDWKTSPERGEHGDKGYVKVICDVQENEKIVGLHLLGPNAGEMIQGVAVAIKAGFTKEHLDDCVGIHPTFAECITTLTEADVKAADHPGGRPGGPAKSC